MMRTPGTTRRRRLIADASSGFQRARVVLYVCVPPEEDTVPILTELRHFAEARDWETAGEIIEDAAPETPITQRSGWQRISAVLDTEHIDGIVMGHGACSHVHPDRSHVARRPDSSPVFIVTSGSQGGAGDAA